MMSKPIVMRILRGLSCKGLPCGCVAGVYETYDGQIVGILDAKAPECSDRGHRDGDIIPFGVAASSLDRMDHRSPPGHVDQRSPRD